MYCAPLKGGGAIEMLIAADSPVTTVGISSIVQVIV
jgi:hypothetical protein